MRVNGTFIMKSNYILWSINELPVEKVIITNATSDIVFEHETLIDLAAKGYINITLEAMNATVLNNPTGILADVSVISPVRLQLSLQNGEMFFTTGGSEAPKQFHLNRGNITIVTTNDPMVLNLRLKQPVIALDGMLQTRWEGSFLHRGLLYSTISAPRIWPIKGAFTIQILYGSGTILAKITNIHNVTVVIPKTG